MIYGRSADEIDAVKQVMGVGLNDTVSTLLKTWAMMRDYQPEQTALEDTTAQDSRAWIMGVLEDMINIALDRSFTRYHSQQERFGYKQLRESGHDS